MMATNLCFGLLHSSFLFSSIRPCSVIFAFGGSFARPYGTFHQCRIFRACLLHWLSVLLSATALDMFLYVTLTCLEIMLSYHVLMSVCARLASCTVSAFRDAGLRPVSCRRCGLP